MAAIAHAQTIDDTVSSTTSATYVSAGSINSSNFVGSGKYLLIVTAQVGSSSAASNAPEFHVIHGSTEFASSHMRAELNADPSWNYAWFTVFTQPATPETIEFEHLSDGTNSSTVHNLRMIAIRLDDDLTENTDWHFVEDTTGPTTHTTAMVERESLTFTPGTAGNEWLILARGQFVINSASVNYEMELLHGGTGVRAADAPGQPLLVTMGG